MITYMLAVTVAPKDGPTAAGQVPELPSGADLCEALEPLLAEATARHALLGYAVTEVSI